MTTTIYLYNNNYTSNKIVLSLLWNLVPLVVLTSLFAGHSLYILYKTNLNILYILPLCLVRTAPANVAVNRLFFFFSDYSPPALDTQTGPRAANCQRVPGLTS